jgi:hypothetical protein
VRFKTITPAAAVLAALTLAGCGSSGGSPTATAAGSAAPPSLGPAFVIGGDAHTGASPAMALEGSYQIRWSATPDKPGCTFHLFVATNPNGPPVVDLGQTVLAGKDQATGSASFSVASGRYFIRTDRSAREDCRNAWTASLNAEVAGSS